MSALLYFSFWELIIIYILPMYQMQNQIGFPFLSNWCQWWEIRTPIQCATLQVPVKMGPEQFYKYLVKTAD